MVQNYKDLVAWQKGMDLVEAVYRLTYLFPKEETYALTSQVRRAAVSIPSNIAEGQGRNGRAEFRHFLSVAYGSLQELETQLLISERLGYASKKELVPVIALLQEVCRVTNGLSRSLSS